MIVQCFFNEYKLEIYKKNKRTNSLLKFHEKILLLALVLMPIGLFLYAAFGFQNENSMWFYFLLVSAMGITLFIGQKIAKAVDERMKIGRNSLIEQYVKKKIAPLTALLKDQQYEMYNKESIEWLITKCNEHMPAHQLLNSEIGEFIKFVLFPVGMAIFGYILGTKQLDWIVQATAYLVALFGSIYLFSWFIKRMNNMGLSVYSALKADLEYILTRLPDESLLEQNSPKPVKVRRGNCRLRKYQQCLVVRNRKNCYGSSIIIRR